MKRYALWSIAGVLLAVALACEQPQEQGPPPTLGSLEPLGESAPAQPLPVQPSTAAEPTWESSDNLWNDFSITSLPAARRDVSAGLQLVRDARIARASGDEQRARRLLETALGWDMALQPAWELLLEIQQDAGDIQGAAETCVRMVGSLTLHAFDQAQLEQRCALLNRSAGRLDAATTLARQSVAHAPGRIEPLTTLTGMLLESGNYIEVVGLLEGNIRFPGSDLEASAFNNLGAAYAGLGQYEQAEATYRRGLEINSSRTDILLNLSDVLRLTGRTAEMQEVLGRILEIDPDHQEAARRSNQ